MNTCYIFFSLFSIVFSAFSTSVEGCKGCVNLDEYNFYKVLPKFETVLVKFDVAYPYGDTHEAFNSLATETVDNKELILAQVAIKDYGEKDNEEFSKKFGINSKEDLPALRLFVRSEDEPFIYEKNIPWNNENLKKFIREHTNIYLGLPGCIEIFDRLAQRFITEEDKEQLLKETRKQINKLTSERDKDIAGIYIKIMKKVLDNSYSFVLQENARLQKILSSKLNDKKRKELSHHQNILKSFIVQRQKSEL